MDQFNDRLDRLSELSEEELAAFESEIASSFEKIDQSTLSTEVVSDMQKHVAAAKSVREERTGRVKQAQELATAAQELSAQMSGSDNEDEEATEEATEAADATEESTDSEEPKLNNGPAAPEDSEPIDAPTAPLTKDDVLVDEEEEVRNPPKSAPGAATQASTDTTPEAELSAEEITPEADSATELSSEAPVETESSEEPVTASASTDGLVPNEDRAPVVASAQKSQGAQVKVAITAGADVPGVPMGSSLPDMKAVANALLERKRAWGNTTGGDGEKSTVAKIITTFPEDRTLDENDIAGNRHKVEAVVASAMERNESGQTAIIAAGGIVAPVENRYDLFAYAESTARPVRDSLLVFNATRGGIRYITPPTLEDISNPANGGRAVSLWTLQDDIDAGTEGAPNPVKPCLRVQAGKEIVVYTEAIPLCLTFGNLHARTYPELVERHTELAMVWHARFAEVRLLTRIGQLSAQVVMPSQLGAARDIFAQVDTAVAGYRSRNRLDDNSPLRAIFPSWFRNALRVDLIKQLPGDGRDGTFNLKPAEIDSWFNARNINVTWHNDGEEGQIFAAQEGATTYEVPAVAPTEVPLESFPEDVIWYLFAEGTFLFLDGGELDLGLVRDSQLNAVNDYKIFLETFEGVAKVGIESLRIRSALAFQGSTSGTVDLAPAAPAPTV